MIEENQTSTMSPSILKEDKELQTDALDQFDEKYIKLLMIATSFMSDVYYMKSEREVQNGYVDVLFLERPPNKVAYQYIFELKYLKKGDARQIQAIKEEASDQLRNYISSEPSLLGLTNLRAYVWVVVKDVIHSFELGWRVYFAFD